jgi:hypothetical protein
MPENDLEMRCISRTMSEWVSLGSLEAVIVGPVAATRLQLLLETAPNR